jgi:hypothetical protein
MKPLLRSAGLMLVLIGLTAVAGRAGLAQESTPVAGTSALSTMGYPEIVIEVSDTEVRVPGTAAAGRTLITYRNTGAESRHAFLARLPDDLTIGEILTVASADEPPPWLFESTFPGFPSEVPPGEQQQAVVDLTPGLYLLAEDFVATFLVFPSDEGGTPAAVAAPDTSGTVRLFEFGFEFPDNVSAGSHVWEVVNAGRVPHELLLAKVPDGTTAEQIVAAMTGEGDAGGFGENSATPVGGIGWLSPGVSGWTEVDLEPGTYAALCFVFDPESGMPHAAEGMVQVFEVATT